MATLWGLSHCSWKIAAFLATHTFQQRYLGRALHTLLRRGFLWKFPLYCLCQDLNISLQLDGIIHLPAIAKNASCYTLSVWTFYKEILTSLLRCFAQLTSGRPPWSPLCKLSAVNNLSCTRIQLNILTLGRPPGFHTYFHILLRGWPDAALLSHCENMGA